MSAPFRLAWFSPLPESPAEPGQLPRAESLTSYCTELLLPELLASPCVFPPRSFMPGGSSEQGVASGSEGRLIEITVFTDAEGVRRFRSSGFSASWNGPIVPVDHYLSAWRFKSDLSIYQLEDRPELQVYRVLSTLEPGLTWFHDFLFNSFGPEPILNSPWQATVAIAGDASEARHSWPPREDERPQRGPQAFREASLSLFNVFTAERSRADFEHTIGATLAAYPDDLPRSALLRVPVPESCFEAPLCSRAQSEPFEVAFCGGSGVESRTHKLLYALRHVPQAKLVWLVSLADLVAAQELCATMPEVNVELRVGRNPAQWNELLNTADCAVHTLFSAFGEVAPYLQISMSRGVPCVVTRFGSMDYLPHDVVFAVDPGVHEGEALTQVLRIISESNLSTFRERARSYAREECTVSQVASDVRQCLRYAYATKCASEHRLMRLRARARASLREEQHAAIGGPRCTLHERELLAQIVLAPYWALLSDASRLQECHE